MDSGLEIAHEDLSANVVSGSWNFSNGTSNPTSTATSGDHGTSVSGLIAAMRGNGLGGIGVAPSAGLNGYNLISGSNQTLANYISALGGRSGIGGPRSDDVWVFNQSYGSNATTPLPVNGTLAAQYLDGVTNLRGGLGAVYVKGVRARVAVVERPGGAQARERVPPRGQGGEHAVGDTALLGVAEVSEVEARHAIGRCVSAGAG